MNPLLPYDLGSFLDTVLSLGLALVLGALIGAERQYRERIANLRTNVLVALGSAQFVDMGVQLGGAEQGMRVVANVVTGVGFLGAGLIMKEGANIRGLNTAATVWCSAAVGACAGANLPVQAVSLTIFVLLCNTALRPVVNAINRIPVREQAIEANYDVFVTVPNTALGAAREAVLQALAEADYPVSNLDLAPRGAEETAVIANLISISVKAAELDAVVARLRRLPGAKDAGWERSNAH
ncbi:MgtC/SapB family protein [Roseomonas sp. AR75]|uniref:MgtC/SapB family protein n=1 Tax=Roseomonas sp. AR75 TaxID=2562311 RepID=UPI0010C03F7D|nr:MgtC/SapB family protein [Roseomonas sp. AR75]